MVVAEILALKPEQLFEPRAGGLEIVHGQTNMLHPDETHLVADRPGILGIGPTVGMGLDQLHRQPRRLIGIDKGLKAIGGIKNLVLVDGHADVAQVLHIGLDVIAFQGDMLQALAMLFQELVDPRFGVPVLDDVQPAVVAQQHARIVLHALALVVAEVPAFEPKDLFQALAGGVHVAHRHAYVLHSYDRHVLVLHSSISIGSSSI